MYVKGQNRGGHPGPLPVHPKKHHKPYRIRHVGLFAAGILMVVISAFAAGYLAGGSAVPAVILPAQSAASKSAAPVSAQLRSARGFSLNYDPAVFAASGATDSQQNLKGNALKQGLDLAEISLQPLGTAVDGPNALSTFQISMDKDSSAFERFRQKTGYSSQNEALAAYFAPQSDRDFTVKEASRSSETVGGRKFQRLVYEQTPTFDGQAKPLFTIIWTGIYSGKPVKISIQNLLSEHIPSIYGPVLSDLHFGDQKVLAAHTAANSFDVNKVSPAVVKIYRFVCGTLVINGVRYGQDACDGATGSGFLVSSNGYIATSGHVVVLDAADILVSQLLKDPDLLRQFITAAGLDVQQSGRSDVVASVLAKIYDLPPQKLRLENRREAVFASLGSRPLDADNQQKAKKALTRGDDDFIKRAEVLAVNYQPKDLLTIEQKDQDGFSASDIALLKINVRDAPYIRMADSAALTQNTFISLMGFPADADNQLTENSAISPSVTDGTINSIRQANGSSSLLFQTDADASEGSSGGPAINPAGEAFGLVTYRFKSANETDAAKSYIRDIADFKEMADSKDIAFKTSGSVQTAWEQGLDLFASQRYSKALVKFRQVQQLYPAHRLVGAYAARAQQAISDGKDKKDPPYGIIIAVSAGLSGLALASVSTVLIIRHRRAHLAYKAAHLGSRQTVSPAA